MNLPYLSSTQRERIAHIGDSYLRLTGRPLVVTDGDLVEALWSAPFAVVAHGTEADPVFYFGNQVALQLFEMDFGDFTQLPSRMSAEPLLQAERARLLARVTQSGIIEDYAGVRIAASGKRFRISDASVWNLTDAAGIAVGQAAAFNVPAGQL
ncbi:MEKHLA domain-containing protein [Hyphomicrobium methylovorum]|uniref:MEKHLA domain-containing protein n=1 Tax=Hyphomicrobium methylovorum TaxID=84 RepID=UPI0015E7A6D9|nr:MEKHLA domain-containing protein [Hyphomicrobium methylovorum]MBA2127192.1 MEKHLA domain-containing protein [Hyphomicrobium methylovorum]